MELILLEMINLSGNLETLPYGPVSSSDILIGLSFERPYLMTGLNLYSVKKLKTLDLHLNLLNPRILIH